MFHHRVRQMANHMDPAVGTPMKRQIGPNGGFTVAVLGAAGGIGQPLSLLLKQHPLVRDLRLYDIANVAGVAADVSHVNSRATVRGFTGPSQLGAALAGCDLVVIPAGIPRKPGMSRDDLFAVNAGIVRDLVDAIAAHCPAAWLNIISNPVNSTVPVACEVLKKHGVFDRRQVLGVTHLDVMRAKTFVSELSGGDPLLIDVPVIGGHAGVTILPLLSRANPAPTPTLTKDVTEQLTARIQNGGTEVVDAKAGQGSATLSMAAAGAEFAGKCLSAMGGEKNVNVCAYVASDVVKNLSLPFFASRIRLGESGVAQIYPLGNLSEFEKSGLARLAPQLRAEIAKGVEFANKTRTL